MQHPIRTLDQIRPFLLSYRKVHKLSQAALASRLGVTQQSYAALEARPEVVSVARLFEVLQALGVELVFQSGTGASGDTLQQYVPALTAQSIADAPQRREDW